MLSKTAVGFSCPQGSKKGAPGLLGASEGPTLLCRRPGLCRAAAPCFPILRFGDLCFNPVKMENGPLVMDGAGLREAVFPALAQADTARWPQALTPSWLGLVPHPGVGACGLQEPDRWPPHPHGWLITVTVTTKLNSSSAANEIDQRHSWLHAWRFRDQDGGPGVLPAPGPHLGRLLVGDSASQGF